MPKSDRPQRAPAQPIFIFGVPRSGTTLMGKILDRHSALSIFQETNFFTSVWEVVGDKALTEVELQTALAILRETLRANGLGADAVRGQLPRTERTTAMLFEAILAARMLARGKRRFGDKTPFHFFCLDRLLQQYPDARLIFVVRDPRSTFSSYKRASFARRVRRRDRTAVGKALQWMRYLEVVARVERSGLAAQAKTVSFETLLRAPEQTVADICEFLGETFEPAMLAIDSANSSFGDLPANTRGISPKALDRKDALTLAEQVVIELICGGTMVERAYAPHRVSPRLLARLESAHYYRLQRALHQAARAVRRRLAI